MWFNISLHYTLYIIFVLDSARNLPCIRHTDFISTGVLLITEKKWYKKYSKMIQKNVGVLNVISSCTRWNSNKPTKQKNSTIFICKTIKIKTLYLLTVKFSTKKSIFTLEDQKTHEMFSSSSHRQIIIHQQPIFSPECRKSNGKAERRMVDYSQNGYQRRGDLSYLSYFISQMDQRESEVESTILAINGIIFSGHFLALITNLPSKALGGFEEQLYRADL